MGGRRTSFRQPTIADADSKLGYRAVKRCAMAGCQILLTMWHALMILTVSDLRSASSNSTSQRPGPAAVRVALLLTGLLGAVIAPPVAAQEQYTLERDKTWQKQTPVDPDTPEGALQAIRKLLALNHGREAEQAATQWITQHPNHAELPEAHILRGDARVIRKNYYKALFDYEVVLRQYSDTTQFLTALEREFRIAKLFESGMRRKLWGLRILSADGEAEELFIRIQERAPGSALGEQASLALGNYYFVRAEMSSAVEAYDLFLANYPKSEHREQAMLQLIRANLTTFKGPRFDAAGLIEASARLKAYRSEFPAGAEELGADALIVRIDESLALKDLYTGRWYEKRHQRVSATYLYERVVRNYPQTGAARQAIERYRLLTGNGNGIDDLGTADDENIDDAVNPQPPTDLMRTEP